MKCCLFQFYLIYLFIKSIIALQTFSSDSFLMMKLHMHNAQLEKFHSCTNTTRNIFYSLLFLGLNQYFQCWPLTELSILAYNKINCSKQHHCTKVCNEIIN